MADLCSFVQVQKDTIESVENEFDTGAENQAHKQSIIGRISDEGAITFRELMAIGLYEPRLGYYCSGRETMGRAGDYLTSPEVSPVFGAMVGRQLREMWEVMGWPVRFQIVESGAGTGALCPDIMPWSRRTAPEFFTAMEYTIVEVSRALAARQREIVAEARIAEKGCWVEAMPDEVE